MLELAGVERRTANVALTGSSVAVRADIIERPRAGLNRCGIPRERIDHDVGLLGGEKARRQSKGANKNRRRQISGHERSSSNATECVNPSTSAGHDRSEYADCK